MGPCILSILIVNWNTRDLLRQCLESVYGSPPGCAFEILVIDNASADGSAAMLAVEFPQVRLIQNEENLGFARANNQAIRRSRGGFVLLLNSDTEILPGALQCLVDEMQSHPTVDAIGPQMLNPDLSPQSSYGSLPNVMTEIIGPYLTDTFTKPWGLIGRKFHSLKRHRNLVRADRVSFACTLIRRETLQRIGLLDERFPFYSEDYDWFKRLRDAGGQAAFCQAAKVIHHWGASSRRSPIWFEQQLYRSKRLYYLKHAGPRAELALRFGLGVRLLLRGALTAIATPTRWGDALRRTTGLLHDMWQPLPAKPMRW